MNVSAFPDASDFGEFAGSPPILIAATSDEALARAIVTAESAGYRAVVIPMDEAARRLEIQPQASVVWVELDKDSGSELDDLLDQVQAEARSDHCPAVIASSLPLVDRIMARVEDSSVELLVDPSPAERTS